MHVVLQITMNSTETLRVGFLAFHEGLHEFRPNSEVSTPVPYHHAVCRLEKYRDGQWFVRYCYGPDKGTTCWVEPKYLTPSAEEPDRMPARVSHPKWLEVGQTVEYTGDGYRSAYPLEKRLCRVIKNDRWNNVTLEFPFDGSRLHTVQAIATSITRPVQQKTPAVQAALDAISVAERKAEVAELLEFFSPEKIKEREAADQAFENYMEMVEEHKAADRKYKDESLKRKRLLEFEVSDTEDEGDPEPNPKKAPKLERQDAVYDYKTSDAAAIEAAKACLQECAERESDRAPRLYTMTSGWTAQKALADYKRSEDPNPDVCAHMEKLIDCTLADLDKIRDQSNAPEERTVDEWNKLCAVGLLLAEHRCSK